jgi:RNA polymerase sigma-70 factor (ECF subfamily)
MRAEMMNETILIHDSLKGDLDAFNRLVLAYQDQVYNQAYRMLGECHASEDATQTAFISAYKKLAGFRGGSFKAWLLRIVTNACYDELRRRNAHPSIPLEPVDEEGAENEYPYWMADEHPHPEELVERKELETAIQHSLQKIAPEYREVLILVDMQGMSYAEVADALGKPIGTVKSRLARGRMQLGAHLRTYWDLLPTQYTMAFTAAV